jgi:transposase-like protein
MRRHKWIPGSHVAGQQEWTCANCQRTRRQGKGPRGADCWEWLDHAIRGRRKFVQYTSGNDPKCGEVRR